MTILSPSGPTAFDLNAQLLDLLPAAVYVCDAKGLIRYYNRRAAELWGREPRLNDGDDRFCGSYRLVTLDGSPLPDAANPMAEALRTDRPLQNGETVVERPDGSRFIAMVDINPIRNEAGDLVGAVCVFQDVTEEKRLAEESKRNEERLRDVVSALPAAVYTTDREGRITFFNEAAAELWGRRPELDKELWCGSFRMYQPEDGSPLPFDQCPMALALQEGRSVRDMEILVERPDGVCRLIQPYPEPLRDASGELVGAVNMLVDVTDRKQADETIRNSEARFRAIVEAIPECVKIVSADGTILEINPAGLAMVEADRPEDVVGRAVYDLIAPEDRKAFREFNEQVGRGQGKILEFDIIGLRGTRRNMESHGVPLPDAKGSWLLLAVTRDVTERNRAHMDRKHMAAIVESSDDVIVSKTLDGIITSWNKGAERILGYSADEIIGKHVSLLMPPENIEDTHAILGKIRKGEKVDHYETKRRAKDGRILDVSITVSPVHDAAGRIVGASKVGRDITEQRRIAAALKQANRRKDEFLAMLAHELRNPISAINNAVLLARRCELSEPLQWSTEVIERQVKQLARLIDDLLDVSRINSGKIQIRKEVVDIGPILNNAVDTVRPFVEERKHKLFVSFGAGSLRVNADPVRLEQIAVNLLTNAAKYTESEGSIWLTVEQTETDVVIQVRDTGIGIPPDQLPEMFELFAQGDRSLARSEGGLGIGLTLVKSLVEMHQGTITASSEGLGKGSEFTVRFPAVRSPQVEAVKALATENESETRASRILVVDDNADSANGLARLLKLLGHHVHTAHDGLDAISIARTYRPDVVLLDIGLPDMDGYEVARRLRKQETCKDSIIVAISGYGQAEDRRRGREAGFNHHLVKPVDQDVLLTLLPKN